MNEQNPTKLNALQTLLPEGLLVPTPWLEQRGYSRSLIAGYVKRGWLVSPAHGVYRRPGAPLRWQQVVLSLGRASALAPHVGGLSALEWRGYAHFLKPRGPGEVDLYAPSRLPGWVGKLGLPERFVAHGLGLFAPDAAALPSPVVPPAAWPVLQEPSLPYRAGAPREGVANHPWGVWNDPLPVSLPERAMLEFLEEVPSRHTLEHAALLVEGLHDLSSRRVLDLLAACRSVKVKRLFLALSSRQDFQWVKPVLAAADRGEVALGSGKRSLVKGGKLDARYQITVPDEDADGTARGTRE